MEPLLPGGTRAVIERYESMVYGIAVTHTECRGDADDVYQEVFLTYHRRQPQVNDEEHRRAWLITTTLNCARRVRLSSWRTRVVPLEGAHQIATQEYTLASDEQNVIFRALRSLPETYRTVLYLFYFEDLAVAQIADLLDATTGTVKVRLSRGRALMKEKLLGGSTRLVDGIAYLVTRHAIDDPAAIDVDDPATFVPQVSDASGGAPVNAVDVMVSPRAQGADFTVITSIDLEARSRIDAHSVLGERR